MKILKDKCKVNSSALRLRKIRIRVVNLNRQTFQPTKSSKPTSRIDTTVNGHPHTSTNGKTHETLMNYVYRASITNDENSMHALDFQELYVVAV